MFANPKNIFAKVQDKKKKLLKCSFCYFRKIKNNFCNFSKKENQTNSET